MAELPTTRRKWPITEIAIQISRATAWLALAAFFIVLTIKLAFSAVSFGEINISFDQLLSLIIALFSIGISLAFYFSANETSNKFYHHVYQFMKDTSVDVRSFQSGFTEKLDHIGSHYDEISRRVEGMPALLDSVRDMRGLVSGISERGTEERGRLREVIDRLPLADADRAKLSSVVTGSEAAAAAERSELTKRIDDLEAAALSTVPSELVEYLATRVAPVVAQWLEAAAKSADPTDDDLRAAFQACSSSYSRGLLVQLRREGLTEGRELTSSGLQFLRSLLVL